MEKNEEQIKQLSKQKGNKDVDIISVGDVVKSVISPAGLPPEQH